jgi:hypothetical protein
MLRCSAILRNGGDHPANRMCKAGTPPWRNFSNRLLRIGLICRYNSNEAPAEGAQRIRENADAVQGFAEVAR